MEGGGWRVEGEGGEEGEWKAASGGAADCESPEHFIISC